MGGKGRPGVIVDVAEPHRASSVRVAVHRRLRVLDGLDTHSTPGREPWCESHARQRWCKTIREASRGESVCRHPLHSFISWTVQQTRAPVTPKRGRVGSSTCKRFGSPNRKRAVWQCLVQTKGDLEAHGLAVGAVDHVEVHLELRSDGRADEILEKLWSRR